MKLLLTGVAVVGVAAAISPAGATVVPVAYYRLGEADPGAGNGVAGKNPTEDSTANNLDLTRTGTAMTYSNNTPSGSTLSMDFPGTAGVYYSRSPVISTATDNFGIEAWVNADDTSGNELIAYNGNTSSSGWGLYRFGTTWGALYGGLALWGHTGPLTTGTWTHLALVKDSGTATFYVNGTAGPTRTSGPAVPNGSMWVGGHSAGEEFGGLIDEVRVFTFTAGQFSTDDLLYPVVPEPASMALALLGGAVLFRRRK